MKKIETFFKFGGTKNLYVSRRYQKESLPAKKVNVHFACNQKRHRTWPSLPLTLSFFLAFFSSVPRCICAWKSWAVSFIIFQLSLWILFVCRSDAERFQFSRKSSLLHLCGRPNLIQSIYERILEDKLNLLPHLGAM